MDLKTQKLKYQAHKRSAAARGIDFSMTFDEWAEIWSGQFHRRGVGPNDLGMLRHLDAGGYEVGNVRLGTPKENHQERSLVQRLKSSPIAWANKPEFHCTVPVRTSWVTKRNYVFDEYIEDDE